MSRALHIGSESPNQHEPLAHVFRTAALIVLTLVIG